LGLIELFEFVDENPEFAEVMQEVERSMNDYQRNDASSGDDETDDSEMPDEEVPSEDEDAL